jgi:hypothetical protein
MTTNDRVKEIEEEYFNFCLLLLQKIPYEEEELILLSAKAHFLKNELKKEIVAHLTGCKHEAIAEIENEIEKIRTALKIISEDDLAG